MIDTLINGYKVSFAEGANHFIHFLKRVPLLGKHVSEDLYRETKGKLVLGIVKEVLSIIFRILKKALYLCFMILLPAGFIAGEEGVIRPIFIHMLFFLNFIVGPIIRDIFTDKLDKKGFLMVVLMREDPKKYYLSEIIFKNLMDFLYFLLPMIIIGQFTQISVSEAIILLTEFISFRLIIEGIILFIWDKRRKDKKDWIQNSVIIIGVLVAYAIPIIKEPVNFSPVLFNPFFLLGVIVLAAAALVYVFSYKGYKRLAGTFMSRDNIYKIEEIKKNIRFVDVQINDKNMDVKELKTNRFEKKTGYDYLNSLFFYRHKKIIEKPMKVLLAVIAVIFILAALVLIFGPISQDDKQKLLDILPNSTPFFVFWMYMISTGEKICKAMFYNCDVSLLRYGYYKESKVILSNFTSRMKRVVILNVIPAVALCLALAGVFLICDGADKLMTMVPLFLCIICLSAFFAIHHLFMYYVLQPYTKELTIKSPAFKVVNSIMYIVCYFCSSIEVSSVYFTLGVSAVTVIYMIVALVVTYKLAPKNFKLK
ncbi:MAG: hypothetical protein GX206_09040 [Clostridiales bacterium]|nr:hypothetical protein [Clostridiales bacterium]